MRHRVGRHQQFEAEQPRQEVVLDVTAPEPRLAGGPIVFPDVLDHRVEERTCAASRVQNKHSVRFLHDVLAVHIPSFSKVREPFGTPKALAKQIVHGAHDVRDNWLRRVVNTTALALGWVIGGQKRLVEVKNRILVHAVLAEVGQHRVHFGGSEQLR